MKYGHEMESREKLWNLDVAEEWQTGNPEASSHTHMTQCIFFNSPRLSFEDSL